MSTTFCTTKLDEALKKAKEMSEKGHDILTSTRNFDFKCNGGIYLADKKNKLDHTRLNQHSIIQVCKILKIPAQWVKTKQELQDPEHLAESLNRHVKKLPSMGILLRGWDMKGKNPFIRAVFPDNVAVLDIYDALKALKVKLGGRVTQWQYITIGGFTLRAAGLLDNDKLAEKRGVYKKRLGEMFAGVQASASETGEFPISGDVFVWRCICENGAVLQDQDLSYSLKRTEKEEGGLNKRFRDMLDDLRSKVTPAFARHVKRLSDLSMRPVGDNREKCIHIAAGNLVLPGKFREGILSAWQPKERSLFGLWNAITRHGQVLNQQGQFTGSYTLQKAAGRLAESSPRFLDLLQDASGFKASTNN